MTSPPKWISQRERAGLESAEVRVSDDALRAFQKANGLEPLGEAEVFTLAALGLLPEDRPAPRTRAPVR